MEPIKLFVDDTGTEPPGWVRARTVKEAVYFLTHYHVTELSLDYDLKPGDPKADWILKWIVKFGKRWGKVPEVFHIHTHNPIGREVMSEIIRKDILGYAKPIPLISQPQSHPLLSSRRHRDK